MIADDTAHPDGSWPPGEGAAELVQRLRGLRWPEVPAEVRQRCWEQLREQVAALRDAPEERSAATPGPTPPRPTGADLELDDSGDRRFGRHDFATRHATRHDRALERRVSVARRATGAWIR